MVATLIPLPVSLGWSQGGKLGQEKWDNGQDKLCQLRWLLQRPAATIQATCIRGNKE